MATLIYKLECISFENLRVILPNLSPPLLNGKRPAPEIDPTRRCLNSKEYQTLDENS